MLLVGLTIEDPCAVEHFANGHECQQADKQSCVEQVVGEAEGVGWWQDKGIAAMTQVGVPHGKQETNKTLKKTYTHTNSNMFIVTPSVSFRGKMFAFLKSNKVVDIEMSQSSLPKQKKPNKHMASYFTQSEWNKCYPIPTGNACA